MAQAARRLTEKRIIIQKKKTLSIVARWGLLLYSTFVIMVLMEPAYVSQVQQGILHRVFSISKYIAAVSVVFLYIIRRPKINGLLLGCVIFEALLLFSTSVNSANMDNWMRDGAYVIIFVLFLQTIMEMDPEMLLLALSLVLGAYVNINTLSYFAFPNGMYKLQSLGYQNCWFLGYDNVASVIIVVAITVSLFRILLYRRKWMIWDWSVILGGVWFTFSLNVANAMVAEAGFLLLMILTKNERMRERIGSARLIVLGMVGLFLLIHLFNVQQNELFSFFFKLLQKSNTFSSRTLLWKDAWTDLSRGKIIFGFGVHSSSEYVLHFGIYFSVHLHCYYLQVIYEGGLVAFCALLGWLLYSARYFDKTPHRYCAMVLLAGLLAIMFMWQVEASNNLVRYFIIVLFLLYNAKELETLEPNNHHRKWRLVWGSSI